MDNVSPDSIGRTCGAALECHTVINLDDVGSLAALTTQIERLLDADLLPNGAAPQVVLRGVSYSARQDWFEITNKLIASRDTVLRGMGRHGDRLMRRRVRAARRRST